MNKIEQIIELLFNEGFNSRVDEKGRILVCRFDIPKLECGCNIRDLGPKLSRPRDITRFLIGKYNLAFSEQIATVNRINKRNNIIDDLLS